MRKQLIGWMAVILMASAAAAAKLGLPGTDMKKEKLGQRIGVVKVLAQDTLTVIVGEKKEAKEMAFRIDKLTRVQGDDAGLDALTPGRPVVVTYSDKDGKFTARLIMVKDGQRRESAGSSDKE